MSRESRIRQAALESNKAFKEGQHARRFLVPRRQNPYNGFFRRNETSDDWDSWNYGWDVTDLEIRYGG